jgi:hypothetical protein
MIQNLERNIKIITKMLYNNPKAKIDRVRTMPDAQNQSKNINRDMKRIIIKENNKNTIDIHNQRIEIIDRDKINNIVIIKEKVRKKIIMINITNQT